MPRRDGNGAAIRQGIADSGWGRSPARTRVPPVGPLLQPELSDSQAVGVGVFIKEANVLLANVVQMAQGETHEVVQALSFYSANPGFSVSVRIWCKERCSQASDAVTLEEATKRSRELGVAVVDKEPRPELLIFEPHHQVSALLLDPPIVRVIRKRAEKHLARADMNERKAIRDPDTERSDHVLGEEVARDERIHMEPDELLPGRLTGLPSTKG